MKINRIASGGVEAHRIESGVIVDRTEEAAA